jgi:hypothetical protein
MLFTALYRGLILSQDINIYSSLADIQKNLTYLLVLIFIFGIIIHIWCNLDRAELKNQVCLKPKAYILVVEMLLTWLSFLGMQTWELPWTHGGLWGTLGSINLPSATGLFWSYPSKSLFWFGVTSEPLHMLHLLRILRPPYFLTPMIILLYVFWGYLKSSWVRWNRNQLMVKHPNI